jgi:homoserine dehydrogenase
MEPPRLAIVGLGTVGTWLLEALRRDQLPFKLVAVGNRRHGYLHDEGGLAPARVLEALRSGDGPASLEAGQRYATALEGIRAGGIDLLAEVSQSPRADGEPGLSHLRAALEAGAAVATSNKWPVAHAGCELTELSRAAGVGFRAESTVMSGTPVLAAMRHGLGNATPARLAGVLNATVNDICDRLAAGETYEHALAAAQAAGLAEPDPAEDVDGLDAEAKLMILAALIFGDKLELGAVSVRGISALSPDECAAATYGGRRMREISQYDPASGLACVEPQAVGTDSPFFTLSGPENACVLDADPIGQIQIRGPGAGPGQAGQGVLSDLIALARSSG